MSDQVSDFRSWLDDNGVRFGPHVEIKHDEQYGVHVVTTADVQSGDRIVTVPHTIALSSLNAQVDDAFPFFKDHAKSFTVEALGFFYLMAQWIHKDKSFWKSYLELLPTPEQGVGTPFWFDDEDLLWLQGTDLHQTFLGRQEVWEKYWMDGLDVLKSAGVDTSDYTW